MMNKKLLSLILNANIAKCTYTLIAYLRTSVGLCQQYNAYCTFIALHSVSSVQINSFYLTYPYCRPLPIPMLYADANKCFKFGLNSIPTILEFTVCWSTILKYKTHRPKYAKMVEQSKSDADNV